MMATEIELAPLHNSGGPEVISGKYIVIFKESLEDSEVAAAIQEVSRIVASAGGINAVGSKYDMGKSFRGFSATLDKETLTNIRMMPAVKYVECDQVVSIAGESSGQGPC